MSKAGNWVPLDKALIKTLSNIDRPYSEVEAMFSHTLDVDCDRDWTENGYATLWKWSRGKVKRFLNGIRTESGHMANKKGTGSGHSIHLIDAGLWGEANNKRTGIEHVTGNKQYTTNNPNPKPNKDFSLTSAEIQLSKLLYSLIKKRSPGHKEPDYQKWGKYIDRMIRLDGRDPQVIANVIGWCQGDDFWQNNILSTNKLRDQFDQLFLKMSDDTGDGIAQDCAPECFSYGTCKARGKLKDGPCGAFTGP